MAIISLDSNKEIEMRIQDCAEGIRPYEKCKAYGASSLSDIELLAILLRTGTKTCNVLELAAELLILANGKLINLYQQNARSLQQLKGIGEVKAIQLISLLELSKRIASQRYDVSEPLTSPRQISQCFMERLRHERKEVLIGVYLDAKCRLIKDEVISQGSLTASIVHPREVFKVAINQSAHSVVIIHNHPSGDPSPSKEDINITKRLADAGQLLGIQLLDHLIIGDGCYTSLKETGYL